MRIHAKTVRDGAIMPFVFDHADLSSNWAKYANAEQTKDEARLVGKDPNNYGVVELNAGEVRSIPNQEVEHVPLDDNQAHTQINGEKDEEARLKLMGISDWVIDPETR